MMYPVLIEPDDNGTLLVTCPDLPEVVTFGEDEGDARRHAVDAIEEALAARMTHRDDIPVPSSGRGRPLVALPPLTAAKVELYRAARAANVNKAELGRRLGWHGPQIDRLFDLRHHSKIEHIDQALRAIGKRLVVSVQDAA
ncbi:MAG TPA: type II toxin-antitoxin system HicB family antitoxin [Stellaceae bacterium]|jgi:antitoxin HicB